MTLVQIRDHKKKKKTLASLLPEIIPPKQSITCTVKRQRLRTCIETVFIEVNFNN